MENASHKTGCLSIEYGTYGIRVNIKIQYIVVFSKIYFVCPKELLYF